MMRKSRTIWALLSACLLLPSAISAGWAASSPEAPIKSSDSPAAPVDYERFGTFDDIGTHRYRYNIADRAGLAEAVGVGVFPNDGDLQNDPEYRRLQKEHRLDGPLDKFRPEVDPVLAYYKWVAQKGAQNQGLRLYNIARSLESMGRPWQALKAYHAVVIHFPKSIAWQGSSPWYIGVSSLDSVQRLLHAHPEWNLVLEDAEILVHNGFDQKSTNDVFSIKPGHWVSRSEANLERRSSSHARTLYQRGKVKMVRWSNGDFQFTVHDRPFIIRGISYFPTPVGQSPDYGYKAHSDWMTSDDNRNKRIDGPYDTWVDVNANGKKDGNEAEVGDFRLLSDLGVNTIRLYHQAVNKPLLRDLSDTYGIRVLMGDLAGAYTMGSGADWEVGTDYSDRDQREKMRKSVRDMVETHKDEDYVLMWVLGNENNYGNGNNARKDPRTYYRFINSLARMIHVIDPSRPVAICNGDLEYLDLITKECPDVDVLAINAYRGENGMGESFWSSLKTVWNKAVIISEFGCPAYNGEQSAEDAQQTQTAYLMSNWKDIEAHAAGAGTDHRPQVRQGQGRHAACSTHCVGGCGQVGRAVDQGAVEIKQDQLDRRAHDADARQPNR